MSTRLVAAWILATGIAAAAPVHASVIYTNRSSSVSATHCPLVGPCSTQTQSSTNLSPFSVSFTSPDDGSGSVVRASQQSYLNQVQISVNMSAHTQGLDSANSTLEVDFTLDTPTTYSISGHSSYLTQSSSGDVEFSGFGFGDASCTTSGMFTNCNYDNSFLWSNKTLAAGAYRLFVIASTYGPDFSGSGVGADASFTMTLVPAAVPLPATVWLLLSGLLSLRRFSQSGSRSLIATMPTPG